MKEGKYEKLQILRESDQEQIQEKLNNAFGKISNSLSISDIKLAIQNSKQFSNRIMKYATLIIEQTESLPKAYKYSKEIGVVELVHNGKVWLFNRAYRSTCYAGQSTGGSRLILANDVKEEVINLLLKEQDIGFSCPAFKPVTNDYMIDLVKNHIY
jgi:hypothetical protein